MSEELDRPAPEALLESTKKDKRGKLRLFLGMAPGVGKTYAMLQEAHQRREAGLDVLIGWVDTHKRAETEALLAGLRVLPRKRMARGKKMVGTLDIDEILRRRPSVVVIDEMPHSNPPGARHRKRWQDIEEILNMGIDVWSAMNIQHLESLNGVVERVTGVAVLETVPDRIFDRADEVRLVDLPPDDLLTRLNAGKIYLPEVVSRARDNYFKKSNLVALRELALRYMANRMETQIREQRLRSTRRVVADTNFGTLLVLERISEEAVRRITRFSHALSVDAHVVWWESTTTRTGSDEAVAQVLRFAKRLGAKVDILTGDYETEIARYARQHNLSMIALVSPHEAARQRSIRQKASEVNFLSLSQAQDCTPVYRRWWDQFKNDIFSTNSKGYLAAFLVTLLLFLILVPLQNLLEATNHAMIYLVGVLFTAVRFGSGPAALSALLSVLAFDLSVIAPFWSFHVNDSQYLITFVVMLLVGLVAGQMVAKMQSILKAANWRRHQTRVLFEAARDFSQALSNDDALRVLHDTLRMHLNVESEFWGHDRALGQDDDRLMRREAHLKRVDPAIVRWVYDHRSPAGAGTSTLSSSPYWYLPCRSGEVMLGVIVLKRPKWKGTDDPMALRLVEALVTLCSQTLLRLLSAQEAKQTLISMEADRLRHSLIQSLSHDLRTPITMFKMVSESLSRRLEGNSNRELVDDVNKLVENSTRMERLIGNLLEMARLQTGRIQINKTWISVNDIFTSSCKEIGGRLQGYHIQRNVTEDAEFIFADEVLLVRVFTNLIDNAVKYCPVGTTIRLSAQRRGDVVAVTVSDDGPGLPAGDPQRLFDPFRRGQKENNIMGVGLGLAICRTIARAHDAELFAMPSKMGGASFTLTLPYREMPVIEDEEAILEQEEKNEKDE